MTLIGETTLLRGLPTYTPDDHRRHMENATQYLLWAMRCEANGRDPHTPQEPYRLPKAGGRL